MTALSPDDVAAYRERGILFPYPALDAAGVAAGLAALARIEAQPADLRRSLMVHKSHLVSATLDGITRSPEILDRVESLIGPDILVWGAGFFVKEGGSPSFVSWHQDATYWGLTPDGVVTAWVALKPSTVENGCMRVVPGTHKGDILPHNETFGAANLLSRGQEIAVEVDAEKAVDVLLQAGAFSLHHIKIAHASEPNRSADRRAGFAIRYIAAAVRQQKPIRDTATLVRGENRHGNFELERRPAGELLPEDLAYHQQLWQASLGALYVPPPDRKAG